MLAEERYQIILELLNEHKIVKVHDLVAALGVSQETVRRDLEYLESKGQLKRVHGGAIKTRVTGVEPSYAQRTMVSPREKEAIGKLASTLVDDGDTIIFDVGTTTLEIAKHLRDKKQLTVLTNAVKIALELLEQGGKKVILLGGEIREYELSTSGYLAENALNDFRADKVFVGAGGLTVEHGITDYIISETQVRKKMLQCAEKVIVAADNSKIGVVAFNVAAPISKVDMVVTDWKAPAKFIKQLRELNIEVLQAEEPVE